MCGRILGASVFQGPENWITTEDSPSVNSLIFHSTMVFVLSIWMVGGNDMGLSRPFCLYFNVVCD